MTTKPIRATGRKDQNSGIAGNTMPTFICDFSRRSTPFEHIWEHTVGSGHAPLALRADWQAQLRMPARPRFPVRALSRPAHDDMGTLICQTEEPLYSFFNADQIFDFLLSIGMRPFVELGFMPKRWPRGRHRLPLSGQRHAAARLRAVGDADRPLVRHWAERYGIERGPPTGSSKSGTSRTCRASGPATRPRTSRCIGARPRRSRGSTRGCGWGGRRPQDAWLAEFLAFCQRHDVPADFVSTHYYPTDAFGEIGTDTVTQLADAPRDVMRERAAEARRRAGGRPLFYTEWNIHRTRATRSRPPSRPPLRPHPHDVNDLVEGYSFWTFTDIFEENYFPRCPSTAASA